MTNAGRTRKRRTADACLDCSTPPPDGSAKPPRVTALYRAFQLALAAGRSSGPWCQLDLSPKFRFPPRRAALESAARAAHAPTGRAYRIKAVARTLAQAGADCQQRATPCWPQGAVGGALMALERLCHGGGPGARQPPEPVRPRNMALPPDPQTEAGGSPTGVRRPPGPTPTSPALLPVLPFAQHAPMLAWLQSIGGRRPPTFRRRGLPTHQKPNPNTGATASDLLGPCPLTVAFATPSFNTSRSDRSWRCPPAQAGCPFCPDIRHEDARLHTTGDINGVCARAWAHAWARARHNAALLAERPHALGRCSSTSSQVSMGLGAAPRPRTPRGLSARPRRCRKTQARVHTSRCQCCRSATMALSMSA